MNYNLKKVLVLAALINLAACDSTSTNSNADAKGKDSANATSDERSDSKPVKTVLFFGDSLTAGYGLDDPATESYPSVIQEKIKEAKLPYKVINAGNSGETSAGGKGRIDWILKQKINVFVLELGANDGLRGVPVSDTRQNLQQIIDRVKAKYPDAKLVLTGMQVPPSMGAAYANEFKAMFPELAEKNKMVLIPFLLDKVGGVSKLNQGDGIHPTKDGAKIVADNVWEVMKGIL